MPCSRVAAASVTSPLASVSVRATSSWAAVRASNSSSQPVSRSGSCNSRSVPPQGRPKRAASSLPMP